MMRTLFVALAIIAAAAAQCTPEEIVLDSEAGHAELRGNWVLGSDGSGFRGQSFWSNNRVVSTAAATIDAKFPARRLSGGDYAVFVTYSRADNRATNVPVVVRYLGGTKRDVVLVDQTLVPSETPSKWHFVGTYSFLGNSPDERVDIETEGVATNVIVTVDAIKFERVCGEDTTTAEPTTEGESTTTTAMPPIPDEGFDLKVCKFNCKIDSLACKRACGGRSTIPTLVCWSQCRVEHKQCQTDCEEQAPQPTGEVTTESPRATTIAATTRAATTRATTQASSACPVVRQCSCKTGSIAIWRTDAQGCDYCTCQVSGVVTTARATTARPEEATTEAATAAPTSGTCGVPTKCKCLYGEVKVWQRDASGCITGCVCRLLTTTVAKAKTTLKATTTPATTTRAAECPVAQACRCKTGSEAHWYLDSRGCDYCTCELIAVATVRSTTPLPTTTATSAPGTTRRVTTRAGSAETTTATTAAPATTRRVTTRAGSAVTDAPATTTREATTTRGSSSVTCPPERECRCKPGSHAVWWSDSNSCRTCSCKLDDNAPATTAASTARPPVTTTSRCPAFESCTCDADSIAVTSFVDDCAVCSCKLAFQVSGLALDQNRGSAIAGATVRFSGPFSAEVTTDRNGMFDIRLPGSNSDYTVVFSAYGYSDKTVYIKVTGPTGVIVDLLSY